jgi:hypothetical protein
VPKPAAVLDRRRAIDAALAAPFAQQALRVEYTTYTMRAENTGRSRVILSLDADLPVRGAEDQTADVVFVVRDMRDGRVAASGTDTMALPEGASDGGSAGHGTYRVHFDVPPGSYMMRTVVREPGGLIGSADRRLDVRGISGPGVTASDVILTTAAGSLPVRARAYSEDGVSGLLETYARSAEQLSAVEATVSLVPAGSDRPVTTVRAEPEAPVSDGAGFVRRVKFALPLSGVSPGPYVARVRVASGRESVADLSREVDVVEGHAPAAAPPHEAAGPAGDAPAIRPLEILNGDFVREARRGLRQSLSPAAGRATRGFDAFAASDFPAAEVELAAALKADRPNAAVAFVLGWAHEAAGAHREAIGAWRAAAAIDPLMVPAHLALADAYLRIGEPALAAQAVRAGLSALPDSTELRAKLAEIDRKR